MVESSYIKFDSTRLTLKRFKVQSGKLRVVDRIMTAKLQSNSRVNFKYCFVRRNLDLVTDGCKVEVMQNSYVFEINFEINPLKFIVEMSLIYTYLFITTLRPGKKPKKVLRINIEEEARKADCFLSTCSCKYLFSLS